MSTVTKISAFLAICVVARAALPDDDALYVKLRTAKENYQKETEKLRDGVLTNLKKAEDSARKAGNKSLLDKIKDESEAFQAKGTLPSVVATKEYHRKIRKARKTLEEVYIQSIKTITKAGRADEASTLENELGDFQIAAKIFQGKNFAVVKERLSWHEAKQACEKQGGHLAIVRNEFEAKYLSALVKAEGVNIAFIGATDEAREGTWLWTDGSNVAYSNWDRERGQPNNRGFQGQPEHYAAIFRERAGMWWDVPARDETIVGFICQWD